MAWTWNALPYRAWERLGKCIPESRLRCFASEVRQFNGSIDDLGVSMKQNRTLAAQFFGKPLRFAVDALFKGVMNPVCQVETEANARVPACRANSPVAADIAALDHDNPLEVGPKIVQMELSKKAGANAAVGQSRQ